MATPTALRWIWSGALACALGFAAFPARAEQPKTTPATPAATQAQAPAKAQNSLAAIAAHTKLRRVSDSGAPIVISNSNLSQLADRGVISVGTGMSSTDDTTEPAATGDSAAAPPVDRKAWEQKVQEQEKKVAALQKAYDGFDEKVRSASDPHYGFGAYNVAPGQVSPAVVAKQDLQQKLEAAKKELDALHAEGNKQGFAPTPAPTP
jgi:hypothetical protein